MSDSCALPRTVTTRDIPHPQVGDMQRDHLGNAGLDLTGCNVHQITQAFNEFEERDFQAGKIGLRFETWPPEIRAAMEKYIAEFIARNKGAILAVTTGINKGSDLHGCVLALHWRAKA